MWEPAIIETGENVRFEVLRLLFQSIGIAA